MAKTSESPFAASLCQNAIPVEATWKPILLRKRKTPSEKPGSELGESVNIFFWKKDSHVLLMIMEMILTHQPPTAVVTLGLITEKAMETNSKCAEAQFTSLGMRTSSVLDNSVHR